MERWFWLLHEGSEDEDRVMLECVSRGKRWRGGSEDGPW